MRPRGGCGVLDSRESLPLHSLSRLPSNSPGHAHPPSVQRLRALRDNVWSASGLGVERNGLPHRSARRHVPLLIFCSSLFSVFCRRPYFLALDTTHPSGRDTRHNFATTRQPYVPFSSPLDFPLCTCSPTIHFASPTPPS
jgi:hypothetical protein